MAKLQGRHLSFQMQGDDVRLVQGELHQIGYTIPADEMERKFFGAGTREAVVEFQRKHGLATTGVVDETVAALCNGESGHHIT